jgi:glycine/D-amino acid oxidase-like deaminating enzyme
MQGRTIVVGGGIAGTSAAFWLARERSGRDEVLLLEGATRLGAHASGRSAAIHRAAVDDPVTRALALETLVWLEDAPRVLSGQRLLDAVGLVVCEGLSEDAPPAAWAAELQERGIAVRLSEAERRVRVPHTNARGARTWWLPRAGRVAAHALVQTLSNEAERAGARVVTGTAVRRVRQAAGRVTGVELADGTHIDANMVVLAAGAWSAKLGAEVGCELPLAQSTRHLFVTRPSGHGAFDPRAPIVWDDTAGFYVRPYDGGLLVCACDQAPARPDDVAPRYRSDPRVADRASALARELLHLAEPVVIDRGWCGLRDRTPDDRPVLGPDPRLQGLAWCAGLGGHGLSIGVAAARALVATLEDRDPGLPGVIGPERFVAAMATA